MLDSAPPSAPTVTDAYRTGWGIMLARALELLTVGIVWAVVSAPAAVLGEGVLGLGYSVLVLGPINFGGMYAFLRAARGESPEVNDLFLPFRTNYGQTVLASLLVGVLVMVGLFLLILPGIVALVRLAWVPYLVTEGQREAVAAVRESWQRTAPVAWTILGIELLAVPLILVGLLLLLVGVIPAAILAHLAAASLYAAVAPREDAPLTPSPLT